MGASCNNMDVGSKLLLSLLLITADCISDAGMTSLSDPRWLLIPERIIKLVTGSRTSMYWKYKQPETDQTIRVTLSQLVSGTSSPRLLIRADVDPVSGEASFQDRLYPDRVSLTAVPGIIRIDLVSLPTDGAGRYTLNIDFQDQLPLDDTVEVVVYERPYWLLTPDAEVLVKDNDRATFTWSLSGRQAEPRLQTVTLSRRTTNVTVLMSELELVDEANKWTKQYGEGAPNTMSFDVNRNGSVISLVLWKLTPSDTGVYTVTVTYEDRTYQLEHDVSLSVSKGFGWLVEPGREVYVMESRDLSLIYVPKLPNGEVDHVTFVLIKAPSSELISISHQTGNGESKHSNTKSRRSVPSAGEIRVSYDRENSGVTFLIQNILANQSGSYEVRMYTDGRLVQHHSVDVKVLTYADIRPTFKMNGILLEGSGPFDIEQGQLVVIPPRDIPLPSTELYSVDIKGLTQLYVKGFNTSFLEVMVTGAMLENSDLLLGVYYNFAHDVYKFCPVLSASDKGSLTASANMFGLLALIPCLIILAILIVCLVLRQRPNWVRYKSVAKEQTITSRGQCDKRNYPTDKTDTSVRDTNYPGTKPSSIVTCYTNGSDSRSRSGQCSPTSTASRQISTSTFVVQSTYIKRNSVDGPRQQSTDDGLAGVWTVNQRASDGRTPDSAFCTLEGAEHGHRRSAPDDVLCPEDQDRPTKPRSTSDPDHVTDREGSRAGLPAYRIHRATGSGIYSTLPAFLVKYRIREANPDPVAH